MPLNMVSHDRPMIPLRRTSLETALEVCAASLLVLFIAMVAISWRRLPESIPHHFDFAGRADAWGGKSLLLLFPAIAVVLYVGLTVAARFPHRFNYPWPVTEHNAERQYRVFRSLLLMLKTELLVLFGTISWMTVRTAMGKAQGLGAAFLPVFIVGLFITIAVHLSAAYRAR